MKSLAATIPEVNVVWNNGRLLKAGAACDKYWHLLGPSARRNVLQAARSAINRQATLKVKR